MGAYHKYRYVALGAMLLVLGSVGLVANGLLARQEAVLYLGVIILGVLILGRGTDVSYLTGREDEARSTLNQLIKRRERDSDSGGLRGDDARGDDE